MAILMFGSSKVPQSQCLPAYEDAQDTELHPKDRKNKRGRKWEKAT